MNRRDVFKGLVGAPLVPVVVEAEENPWNYLAETYTCSNSSYYREKKAEWDAEHLAPKMARSSEAIECPGCKFILAFSWPDDDNSMCCLNSECPEHLIKYKRISVLMERV